MINRPLNKHDIASDCETVTDNPIIFVLIGNDSVQKYQFISRYFDQTESVIFIQIYSVASERIDDNRIVRLHIEKDGTIAFGKQYEDLLEQAVRRTKWHKYERQGEVNVCVIVDDYEEKMSFENLLQKLYDDLYEAYFNHIYCDIFYLMTEEFLRQSPKSQRDFEFMKLAGDLEKNEYLRFIVLISEMNNREILIRDKLQIILGTLDSIMIGNCKKIKSSEKGIGIYDRLTEISAASDSKIITVGRLPLKVSDEVVKRSIRYQLTKAITNIKSEKKQIPDISFLPGLDSLFADIGEQMQRIRTGINSVGYYENITYDMVKGMKNSEILGMCFGDNHIEYMNANQLHIQISCRNLTLTFCRTRLLVWLNDSLEAIASNILDTESLHTLINEIYKKISDLIDRNNQEADRIHERCLAWKMGDAGFIRRKSKTYQWELLHIWSGFVIDEFYYEICNDCLLDIQDFINYWKDMVNSRCADFAEYQKATEQQWIGMLQDNNTVEVMMLEILEKKIGELLQANEGVVRNCYNDLRKFVFRDRNYMKRSEQIIEEYAQRLYQQEVKDIELYNEWEEFIGENNKFYESLYYELIQNPVLQIRGNIWNNELEICFLGNRENKFINYLSGKDEQVISLYYMENYEYPVVLFFQHISDIVQIFAYNQYRKKYGEKNNGMENKK